MLGGVAGLARLGAHGLGGEFGPLLPRQAEAPVQLVADALRVLTVSATSAVGMYPLIPSISTRSAPMMRRRASRQPGLAVGTRIAGADVEGGVGGRGLQPVPADDLDEIGRGPGAGMLIQRLTAG